MSKILAQIERERVNKSPASVIPAKAGIQVNSFLKIVAILFCVSFLFFHAVPVSATSWLSGWSYSKAITISNTNVSSTISYFPLLVHISGDSNIGAGVSDTTNGYDIRFTDSNMNLLPYEREDFSVTIGAATGDFWVQVPSISSSTPTIIYIYYGNSSAISSDWTTTTSTINNSGSGGVNCTLTSMTNAKCVWNEDGANNYSGVYHFSQTGTPTTWLDSTSNVNTGTNIGVTATTGQIDGGGSFNGTSNYLSISNLSSIANYSIDIWAKPVSTFAKGCSGGNACDMLFQSNSFYYALNSSGKPQIFNGSSWNNSNTALTLSQFQLITFTYTGSTINFYLNGVLDKTTTISSGAISGASYIGARPDVLNNTALFNGILDEARISSVARPVSWINFEYCNDNSASNPSSCTVPTGGYAPNELTFASQVYNNESLSSNVSSVYQNSTGNSITLTGTGTSWTSGNPGVPTFTLSGGTGASITSQTVASSTTATIVINAGSSIGTLTITDPTTGMTTTISVIPLSADATVTSSTYTVSAVSTTSGGSGTITNVPYGTSAATFEAALTKDQANQTWNTAGIHSTVLTGDTLVVTAQNGSTTATYTITVLTTVLVSTVTIDNTTGSTLTNVQVPVNFNSTNFNFSGAQANGSDVRFTDSSGNRLNYWWQSYNPSTQLAIAWVKIPSMSQGQQYVANVYYGLSGADGSSYDNTMTKLTVDASTLALWHLDEGTGTSVLDSTGNYTLNLVNSPTWAGTDGGNFSNLNPVQSFATGSALTFNGTNQYASATGLLDTVPANGSISMWFRLNSTPGSDVRIFSKITQSGKSGLSCYIHSSVLRCMKFRSNGTSFDTIIGTHTITTGNWNYLSVTWGVNGFNALLNGNSEASNSDSTSWDNGSDNPFVLGAYDETSVSNYAPITVDEVQILNRQLTSSNILSNFDRANPAFPLVSGSQSQKLARVSTNPVLISTPGTWDADSVIEPRVIYNNGVWQMWYTGSSGSGNSVGSIGYATSSDGITWQKYSGNPVLGNGASGEMGNANTSNEILVGSTYYMFYGTSYTSNSALKEATSSDGIHWTVVGTAIPASGSWFNGVANNAEIIVNGVWYMLFEARATNGSWEIGLATSPDGTTWTVDSRGAETSLGVNGGNAYSGPDIVELNGVYNLWYHATPVGGVLPSNLYFAQGTDLFNWTQDPNNPVAVPTGGFEHDQVADPHVLQVGNTTYLYYDGDNNTGNPVLGGVGLMTYGGTISQLIDNNVSNVTVSLTSSTASITASPSSIIQNSTGNTIAITGTNTLWTAGNPTFTISGGTGASITLQTVTDSTDASLTVNAGSSTGTLTITDPSTGATATVIVAANTATTITSFNFTSPAVTGTVGNTAHTVALAVPFGTNVTNLTPTIVLATGATISPTSGTAQNFSSPVTYTVTAQDGITHQDYVVTVTVAANTSTSITSFNFASPSVTGTVDNTAHTVSLTVPYGTTITSLTPTIVLATGATISPTSGTIQNFSSPVTYTVTAQDGTTHQAYIVTVTVALNTAKILTAFDFDALTPTVIGSVNEGAKTVTLTVPYGTVLTNLIPTITINGSSVSPASGIAGNFTTPQTYRVTAADSSHQDYVVTVNVAVNTAKALTTFDFNGLTPAVVGTIDETGKTIALAVPYGTAVTALVPTITITGSSVNPASLVAQSFSTPATYTVTAANASTQPYIVTVTVAPIGTHTITASAGANGSITPSGSVSVNNGSDQSITITPNSGYHIDTVTVDGGAVSATSPYTFTNVTADHTISTTFAVDVVVSHGSSGFFAPYPTAPVGGFTATRDITNSQNKTVLHFGFGNDITNIAISDNINFTPATYINATSSVEWTATTTKILYIKYCNRYGRCSNPISLQINAFVPIVSNSYKFYKNLSYRMTNSDVKELQKYLNTHGVTVAPSGSGSLGKETTYFGLLTYKALIKFQEAHASDILTPTGLKKGTGYFGPSTRAFVNK